ncbi:hypothetical protein SBADM41S_02924 [Streptomyces badius]
MTGGLAADSAAPADPDAADARQPGERERDAGRWPGRLLLAVAVLWALFVAARALLSGRWWAWNGLGLAPPVLHLLLPLVLLIPAALIRHRRRAAVGVVLVLLLLGSWQTGLHPGALLRGTAGRAPGALKVVNWNTFFWDQDSDTDAFYGYLKSHSADVYLLQEYQNARRATSPSTAAGGSGCCPRCCRRPSSSWCPPCSWRSPG